MEKERSIDRLARILIFLGAAAIVCTLCWYFRSVLVYIITAFVVSLIGHPVMNLLRKIRIRGKAAPDPVLAVISLVILSSVLVFVVTQVIPIVSGIVHDVSIMNAHDEMLHRNVLDLINQWIISVIPWVGADFDLAQLLLERLSELTDLSSVPSIVGSMASDVATMAVGVFSVLFISFFFIKDEGLFGRIIAALVPDKVEERVERTINDIRRLLSRYFVGLLVEIAGVVVLNLLGLWLIARIGFSYAIGLAFISGLLNVIPYVGPLIGEVIGVVLCVILKYGAVAGLDVNIWIYALIVFGIMLAVQLVDNFIYQPLIYSTSIKASPLEIFIVLLISGKIGGAVGMLVAIPAYTVIRVIASRFFYDYKAVRRLIPDRENI